MALYDNLFGLMDLQAAQVWQGLPVSPYFSMNLLNQNVSDHIKLIQASGRNVYVSGGTLHASSPIS